MYKIIKRNKCEEKTEKLSNERVSVYKESLDMLE